MKIGETYRYGITSQGKGRYNQGELEAAGLRMEELSSGTYETCKAAEISLIFAYKFLPERIKPESTLIRPPGNPVKG